MMQEPRISTSVPESKHQPNKRRSILISVAVLVVLAIGYLVYNRVSSPDVVLSGRPVGELPDSYRYEKLDDFKLSISGTNATMSFKKPEEIKKFSDVMEKTSSSVNLVHTNKKNQGIAFMTATLFNSTLAEDKTFIDSLNANLKSGEGTGYDTVTEPVRKFVKDATAQGYEVTLSKAKPFTNSDINKNAWVFDVIATDEESKLAPLKGRVVMAIDKQTTYYLGAFTLEHNWNPSQAVWEQVTSSLKLES